MVSSIQSLPINSSVVTLTMPSGEISGGTQQVIPQMQLLLMITLMFEEFSFPLNVVFASFMRKLHIIFSFTTNLHHAFGIGSLPPLNSKSWDLVPTMPYGHSCWIQFGLVEIWLARNLARFKDQPYTRKKGIKIIIEIVRLVGNNTIKSTGASIFEFIIFKDFNISIHPEKLESALRFISNLLLSYGIKWMRMVWLRV